MTAARLGDVLSCRCRGGCVQAVSWSLSSTCVQEKTEGLIFCCAPVDERQLIVSRCRATIQSAVPSSSRAIFVASFAVCTARLAWSTSC